VLIALSGGAVGVIGGRMIQGAAGSTILACGMSLLSFDASGAGQMRAITMWGAASAAGAAAGPLVGGVLVEFTGWQGLFWIDAAIAAVCIPVTLLWVRESRDPHRPRTIDVGGSLLIAVVLAPLVLALSEGADWGWFSGATIGCLIISVIGAVLFVLLERRIAAPLVDLQLLRNPVLIGTTVAILLVAGAINALMYLLSLYFQDPSGFGMSALAAGLATLPAAAAMILITPAITPLAVRIGTRWAIALGFGLATAGFAALTFVDATWSYAIFVLPLIGIAVGLGLANGPASSASTASVAADAVGQASGISNMARYIGGSLAVAATATIFSAVDERQRAAGLAAADALATGLARAALALTIMSAAGVALALLVGRHRPAKPKAVDLSTAAASHVHTIPSSAIVLKDSTRPRRSTR
jgi:MFS family permease